MHAHAVSLQDCVTDSFDTSSPNIEVACVTGRSSTHGGPALCMARAGKLHGAPHRTDGWESKGVRLDQMCEDEAWGRPRLAVGPRRHRTLAMVTSQD